MTADNVIGGGGGSGAGASPVSAVQAAAAYHGSTDDQVDFKESFANGE